MIYLIIGTQNSGKSALAEELSMNTKDAYRVYLATMKIYDDVGRERVKRHRQQRQGKGFFTIEQEVNITNVIDKIENSSETTALLECVSNLVGNEIYENPVRKKLLLQGRKNEFADEIAEDIKKLADSVNNLIIVTNEYAKDEEGYDDETRTYVDLLHMVNERIKGFSDKVFDLRKERRD
jgi:adenosylcobinamide kinase/adenosylcobinamide-phosphate guanylyltransferase